MAAAAASATLSPMDGGAKPTSPDSPSPHSSPDTSPNTNATDGASGPSSPKSGRNGPVVVPAVATQRVEASVREAMLRGCLGYLRSKALLSPGLFRVNPNMTDVTGLIASFLGGHEGAIDECDDPHLVAGVVLKLLRDAPRPIFPFDVVVKLKQASNFTDIQRMLSRLPKADRQLAVDVFALLHEILAHSDSNELTVQQIAAVFGPAVCWPEGGAFMSIRHTRGLPQVQAAVQTMVQYFEIVFRERRFSTASSEELTPGSRMSAVAVSVADEILINTVAEFFEGDPIRMHYSPPMLRHRTSASSFDLSVLKLPSPDDRRLGGTTRSRGSSGSATGSPHSSSPTRSEGSGSPIGRSPLRLTVDIADGEARDDADVDAIEPGTVGLAADSDDDVARVAADAMADAASDAAGVGAGANTSGGGTGDAGGAAATGAGPSDDDSAGSAALAKAAGASERDKPPGDGGGDGGGGGGGGGGDGGGDGGDGGGGGADGATAGASAFEDRPHAASSGTASGAAGGTGGSGVWAQRSAAAAAATGTDGPTLFTASLPAASVVEAGAGKAKAKGLSVSTSASDMSAPVILSPSPSPPTPAFTLHDTAGTSSSADDVSAGSGSGTPPARGGDDADGSAVPALALGSRPSAALRRRHVALYRSLRVKVKAFEEEYAKLHGTLPRGAARNPMKHVYAEYKKLKHLVREDSARHIQSVVRGFFVRGRHPALGGMARAAVLALRRQRAVELAAERARAARAAQVSPTAAAVALAAGSDSGAAAGSSAAGAAVGESLSASVGGASSLHSRTLSGGTSASSGASRLSSVGNSRFKSRPQSAPARKSPHARVAATDEVSLSPPTTASDIQLRNAAVRRAARSGAEADVAGGDLDADEGRGAGGGAPGGGGGDAEIDSGSSMQRALDQAGAAAGTRHAAARGASGSAGSADAAESSSADAAVGFSASGAGSGAGSSGPASGGASTAASSSSVSSSGSAPGAGGDLAASADTSAAAGAMSAASSAGSRIRTTRTRPRPQSASSTTSSDIALTDLEAFGGDDDDFGFLESLSGSEATAVLRKEKSSLKRQLKAFDKSFESKNGRLPSNEEKEPVRHLYRRYHQAKAALAELEAETAWVEESATKGLTADESAAEYRRLRREKRALQFKLKTYEDEFQRVKGRKVRYHKDIVPVEAEYQRYKEIKQLIMAHAAHSSSAPASP